MMNRFVKPYPVHHSPFNRFGKCALGARIIAPLLCVLAWGHSLVLRSYGQAFIPVRPVQIDPQVLIPYQEQIRGLIQNELEVVELVAKPTELQAQQLVDLVEANWEAASLREVTRRVQQHVHGSIDFDGLVERSVMGWCKEVLSAEQLALYTAELDNRQEFRREALIARMLTWLQRKLSLSASQTDEVEKVLRERWKDRWYRSVEATFANETLLPEMNQKWLEDIITPAQRNALSVRSPTEKNTPVPDVFPRLSLSTRFSLGGKSSDASIKLLQSEKLDSADPKEKEEPSP